MPNGEDNPPTGQGGSPQPPTETGPNLGSGARGGMSGLGEGWGTGEAGFDEVVDNVKAVFEGVKGEVGKAWLAVAVVMFALETIEVVAYSFFEVTGILGDLFTILFTPFAWIIGLLYFAGTAAQLSLYGPLRDRVFHEIEPEGWLEALKSGTGRFWTVLGTVVPLALVIPLCCVLPGLILAFFGVMAPYLAATEEIGVVDAFKKSYERSKSYWQVIAVTIGALLAAGTIFGCVMGVGTTIGSFAPEPLDYVLRQYAGWVGGTLFQFGLFVVWGGVFVTVDSNESGRHVQ